MLADRLEVFLLVNETTSTSLWGWGRGKKSQWGKENCLLRSWHIFYLSMRRREFLFEGLTHFFICKQNNKHCSLRLGGEGRKSMRQRELLVEGLTHFFICQWGKENFSLRGWHIFFICQRDNKHCSLRLGGEEKSQWGKENCLLRGWHILCYLSVRQRELLFEGLTHFFIVSTRQQALLLEVWGRGKEVNEAKRTSFWGADTFFLFVNKAKRTACWGADAFFLFVNKTNRTSYWGMTENYFTQSTHLVQSYYT